MKNDRTGSTNRKQVKALVENGRTPDQSITPIAERSEDRYEYFFHSNLDLACFANLDGYFEEVNHNFAEALGYAINYLLERKIFDFIHPDDLEPTRQAMERLSRGVNMVNFVNRFRTKENTYKYLEWNATFNLETKIIFAIARDVTDKITSNRELIFHHQEKEKRAAELAVANTELAYQSEEKEKRAAELVVANKELAYQNKEKEKRAAELLLANIELAYQNEEKENRASELTVANRELAYQNDEKEKRAAELIVANKELAYQNKEKEKRAAELLVANVELAHQNEEKGKRASELTAANHELAYQNKEKERRASELMVANKELAFQNEEKEKRAAELIIANTELAFQNEEKEKRAAELTLANREIVFQNEEKQKQAAELIVANADLRKAENDILKLNEGLEQMVVERTEQLELANRELEAFSYSVSHDLRAPLRAISGNATILEEDYGGKFDQGGLDTLESIKQNSKKMGMLIDDLLAFSKLGRKQVTLSDMDMNEIVKLILNDLALERLLHTTIKVDLLPPAKGDQSLIKQVWINLISNAIKYSSQRAEARIEIGAYENGNQIVYYVKDNGAGFDMKYYDKLFGVFQRLHSPEEFDGTGIGLAIVQKIVTRHNGAVWADAKLDEGACFYFSLATINL